MVISIGDENALHDREGTEIRVVAHLNIDVKGRQQTDSEATIPRGERSCPVAALAASDFGPSMLLLPVRHGRE